MSDLPWFRNRFPYTKLNDINLDWLLKRMKELSALVVSYADDIQRALSQSSTAITQSETAVDSANNAVLIANGASATADAVSGIAEDARTIANAANTTAIHAETVANGIAETAQSALDVAQDAETIANDATQTAGNAQITAQNAVTIANGANTRAANAEQSALTAIITATAAQQTATDAAQDAQTAQQDATAAAQNAQTAQQAATAAAQDAQTAQQAATTIAINKAGIIKETISDNVVNFPDGAADLPLEQLIVHIKAVQSGNGDPAPDNFRRINGWTGCQIFHSGEDTSDPDTITVSWQSEAGTVYYGSLNIKTGVMTVDGGVNVYNGVDSVNVQAPEGGVVNLGRATDVGRAGPDYYSFYTTNVRIGNFGNPTARILTPQEMSDGGFLCTNMPLCTMFETGLPTTNAEYAVGARLTAAGNVRIYIYARVDTGITTVDQMNAKLAEWYAGNTPFAYCFKLKTPFTAQVSPAQLFSTFYGVNNIWTDCGDVSAEYRADTKLYIQKINAPTDNDMISDAQIASGKYFIIGGSLYKSTTVISQGDTVIPGSNCIETNLADALNSLI